MAEREQIRRPAPAPRKQTRARHDSEPSTAIAERSAELVAELDGLLDEIDEVLESNAEDFVKSYVQKGGQ